MRFVKQAELNYVGSITVDPVLMQAAGILEYENVQIVDIENGNRFETYTIAGEPGSGMICLNGHGKTGTDRRSCHYHGVCTDDPRRKQSSSLAVVFVDENNAIERITN